MSSSRVIITVMVIMFTSMVAASPASARTSGEIPWGVQFCGYDGTCATPVFGEQADGSVWTFDWGQMRPGVYAERGVGGWTVSYHFQHFHRYRRDVAFEAISQRTFVYDDGRTEDVYAGTVELHPEANTPDCGQVAYRDSGPVIIDAGPNVDDNAQMRHACFPDVFDDLGRPAAAPTPAKPAVEAPGKAEACAPIVVAKRRTTVSSTGVACASARNILARYMKTGAEPAGWVCSRLAVGRARAASCGAPARSAKKIVGRWRV